MKIGPQFTETRYQVSKALCEQGMFQVVGGTLGSVRAP